MSEPGDVTDRGDPPSCRSCHDADVTCTHGPCSACGVWNSCDCWVFCDRCENVEVLRADVPKGCKPYCDACLHILEPQATCDACGTRDGVTVHESGDKECHSCWHTRSAREFGVPSKAEVEQYAEGKRYEQVMRDMPGASKDALNEEHFRREAERDDRRGGTE